MLNRGCIVLALSVLLFPASAHATDVFETFRLDPSRSWLRITGGDISIQLTSTSFVSTVLTPQPGAAPAALTGQFVGQIGSDPANPTFFFMLPGSSDFRPADANLLLPGPGGTTGTVAAAFGVSFFDAATGLGGNIAVHDVILSASGFFSPLANSAGPIGLLGDIPWIVASSILEIQTNAGIGGTAFGTAASLNHFLFSDQSQYTVLSPGVHEVVLPFFFSIGLSGLPGPFGNTGATLHFEGQLVATTLIPEPSVTVFMVMVMAMAGFSDRRAFGSTR